MRWFVRQGQETEQIDVERVPGGFEIGRGTDKVQVDLIRLDGAIASMRYVKDGRNFTVSFERGEGRRWRLAVGERTFDLEALTPVEAVEAEAAAVSAGPSRLTAPIPGKVVKVHVAVGDEVRAGQPLVVLEAMKMENELSSEQAGRVTAIHVRPGQTVNAGDALAELE
jgi:biotin carboxyl carrier protein